MISVKRLRATGSSGAPTFTSAPSVRSRERNAPKSSGAETVEMIRSKVPASSWKVLSSLVA